MPSPAPETVTSADLARAARLLSVRSLREASGLFAGNYASAFRGGGLEFEESRPYAWGDDVRTIDWNATARSGDLFVKRYREERNQTLLFALDVSASMGFGTTGRAKAATAAHAVALLAAAAGRAGDRCGLVAFDESVRRRVPVGRGGAHTWRVIEAAVAASGASRGGTRLRAALRAIETQTRRRAVVVLLSDFRETLFLDPNRPEGGLRSALAPVSRLHDVVAAVLVDPRDEELPDVGPVRVADPERPAESLLLPSGSRRARQRYRAAWAETRARLERELRRSRAEVVWLRTDRSPLHSLGRFFHDRAARRSRSGP